MDNKCEWDGKNLFLFYILWSWAVLHCWITLLLQDIYLVGFVWPLLYGILISNIHNDPIMIQQLSLTSFFTNYKPNKTIQSFPCWNSCVWVLHCCITSLFMFFINAITLFYWFHSMCSWFLQGLNQTVRVDIQRQAEHISSSTAIALPHTYIQKQLWSLLPFNLNKYH